MRPTWRSPVVGLVLLVIVAVPIALQFSKYGQSPVDVVLASLLTLGAGTTWALLARSVTIIEAGAASRDELQHRLAQQRAVSRLGELALADAGRQQLLEAASDSLAEELAADFAVILQLQPDRSFACVAGIGTAAVAPIPPGAGSHAGFAVSVEEPVIMVDAARERRFTPSRAIFERGITSGISAPIGSNGGTWGAIGIYTRARRVFSADDVSFVAAIASVLMSALAREAAETEAESSRRVLEAVIEGTTDDVFVKDLNGRFVALNERAAATLGWPREETVGRTLYDLLPCETADPMAASDRATLEHGSVETYEESIPVEGETRVFLTTKGPYRARDGTLLGTFGIARDITRRKEQERALARSEERFRLAQEGARMGTWDIDLASGKTTWSEGLRALLGVGPDYPAGFAHFEPLVHADDRVEVSERVIKSYAAGAAFELTFRVVLPGGRIRWVFSRSSYVCDENGTPVRQLGVGVDITERKLAEERLLLAQTEQADLEARLHQSEKLEAIGRLAGGVAHDFNNLLVAIRGYGELALARVGDDNPEVRDYLASSLSAAERATGLTKQLLAFARRQVLRFEVLDLNEVVEEIDALLDRLIGDNVNLVTTTAARPVIVRADKGQLEQVLVNLAVNARDAMPDGGTVTVRVDADDAGRCALLRVSDEGSGIDPALAERIFEPFFTTKGDDGTGLGLATVHGIVTQSGGEIALDTELGRGTTFTISLPLCLEAGPAAARASASPSGGGTETLLLVEDDPVVRAVVAMMLETEGYEVVEAASGEEALAELSASATDIPLVVSDLMMPGLDGKQTLEQIRKLRPGTKGRFMSGYADGIILGADDLGVGTAFIEKPFDAHDFTARVRDLLDSPI